MQTYRLETAINEQGIIVLPAQFKKLYRHKVRLVVTDLEPKYQPVEFFSQLTKRYAALTEPDLDVAQIYQARTTQNERENMFA
jgi:hypothetical protein